MPIYEYRCLDCGRLTSLLVRGFHETPKLSCQRCGGANLRKLVSRVVTLKSEERRLEDLADPSALGGVDENDPKSVARWARKLGDSMGEDLGDDFDEMVDRIEAGEDPESVMGGEAGGGGDGGMGAGDDDL
ncbi:MAG: zinc ribbon domain-containing protein [Chloroflexi bacterium]|nr:zinc ribbon domain-containing protein [Chloroflexota bacterium]